MQPDLAAIERRALEFETWVESLDIPSATREKILAHVRALEADRAALAGLLRDYVESDPNREYFARGISTATHEGRRYIAARAALEPK